MFNKNNTLFILLLTLFSFTISSCVRNEYDEPPFNTADPEIATDKIVSLQEVLNLWSSGEFVKIGLDKYIKAVVVADDRSGNFYKTLVIEDENSDLGITVLIDENNLYNVYPVGRRVFLNLNDTWISDYNGLPQIGYGPYVDGGRKSMASIPSNLMRKVLIPGAAGITVTPRELNINQLGTASLNTLVKLNNMQFANTEETYSDAVFQQTVNRNLEDCAGQKMLLRSSGYSNFAGKKVAQGKGSIVGIYSIYRTDKQFMVRDTNDISMKDPRCGASAGDETRISIKDLRALFKGQTIAAPKNYIQGVVISDKDGKNLNSQNLVIQEGNSGIVVRFSAAHNYNLGDEIKVVTTDVELSEFNGWLQLNNVSPGFGSKVGTGVLPAPKEITIKDLVDNFEIYESTLVKIIDATLSNTSATYSGNATITDATSSMILRTGSSATFASTSLKTGKVNVTAIASEFTSSNFTPQLSMRNINDVEGGGGGTGGNETKISIADLRKVFTGTTTTAPENYIQGVVISDYNNKNINSQNLVIQDGAFGIVVRFTAAHAYALGAELKIKVTGVELSEFNKLLQLNNVPAANVTVVGNTTLPTPKEITIKALKDNFETYESTLVIVKSATITNASGTYSGNATITDDTDNMILRTGTTATFASTSLPAGKKNVTAIVSEFSTTSAPNGFQLMMRDINDVQ